MAFEVAWSPEAVEDVEEIAAYIAKDSAFYAQAVVDRIIGATRALDEQPLRGRVVPELSDSRYRERFVYSYRVIYRVTGSDVLVVAVVHGKRLLESVGERFEGDVGG